MRSLLVKLLLGLVALLPLSAARWIASFFAALFSRFAKLEMQRVIGLNLALVEPALSEQLGLGKKADRADAQENPAEPATDSSDGPAVLSAERCLQSHLMTALELPIVWRRSNAWLNQKITRESGTELIQEALANKRGVIVLCPHVGNWEVFGRKLAEYAPTTSLYQPPKQRYLEDFVRRGREKSGAKLVPTSVAGLASLVRALKAGEAVGILPDQQPPRGSGLYVPFFGVPAYTQTFVHRLIQKTGCSVVLGYAIRNEFGFEVIFKPVDEEIYSDDEFESIAALSKAVESSLAEDYSQYQWAYKRYRNQPNSISPYQRQS